MTAALFPNMASLASAAPALKASKAAEERAPTAELITKARRFMDGEFQRGHVRLLQDFSDDGQSCRTFCVNADTITRQETGYSK